MEFEVIKRTVILRVVVCMLILALSGRVCHITLVEGGRLAARAEEQNTVSLEISENRGNITDRNMKLLTGVNRADYAVIFPLSNPDADFEVLSGASMYLENDFYSLYNDITSGRAVLGRLVKNYDKAIENKYSNVKIISKKQRYLDDSPGASAIGYISGGVGKTGLELLYDNLLRGADAYRVTANTDALRRIIPGYSINVSDKGSGRYTVKTTLDLEYSRICKEALKKNGVTGAAVLIDADSFDILAMESAPGFDPENIAVYLNSDGGNLINRCVQSYDAGSIFKIIVAAAALEKGVVMPQDKFYCSGSCEVAGKEFVCHNINGHGEITFEEGFAKSCNTVFIDIGLKTGYTEIIEMAKKFLVGTKVINPAEFDQKSGTLPDKSNYYLADVANLSIGQGTLSLTPVHGAVISAVIASGGIMKSVNLTDSIINSVGDISSDVRAYSQSRIISQKTADVIYNMMLKTNTEGTGTTGYIDNFGSGGKTGSAQTGWYVDGIRYQHGWFTGFFPAQNPKYALCVFVENGKSGSLTAAPVFKDIGTQILKNYEVEVK